MSLLVLVPLAAMAYIPDGPNPLFSTGYTSEHGNFLCKH
jgi:hypothetical protein